jgi:hypothetical protein
MSSSSPAMGVGTRVRLRHRPDDTGRVIGFSWRPGDVQVRWDDPDQVTHINVGQLEAVSELHLVE